MKRRARTVISYLCIIAIILLVSALLIISVGSSVQKSLASFIRGIAGSFYGFSEVLVRSTPLILAGLGVGMGFRTGFINIGAEGQLYMGAIAVTALGMAAPGLPAIVMIPLALVLGFAFGGIWSFIPGILKAKFGISEVLNTIMFNYIAINLVGILVRTSLKDTSYPYPMSPMLPKATYLFQLFPPNRVHAGFLIALVLAVLMYILLFKTWTGFGMRAVGLNSRACRCAGISVFKNLALSSVISGGLAGIAGVCEVSGLHHRLLEGISPSYGYLAIIVALLGGNHPLWIVVSALGISALQVGSMAMQRSAGVPTSIASIIMGLIVVLILARKQLFTIEKEA
ncbi:ABC transporter permease [uncultured Sphaerochaeta sp.]|uniref:ABC transporter permease n=1 Tax=uncultured Sphaerochaeta sp. TaxID=886478 RepID=UPI002A0A491A|nr:ABC transporter permease [uncultured Sphaerochaeta sp.]